LDVVFYAPVASVAAHGIGGVQRIVERQARWLAGAGHKVRVITSAHVDGHRQWTCDGVEYAVGLPAGEPFTITRWRELTVAAWPTVLAAGRPDVVHGHAEADLGLIAAGLVGPGTGIGIVSALYGSPGAGLLDHARIRGGRTGPGGVYAGLRGAIGILPAYRAGRFLRRSRVIALSERHARMVRWGYAPLRLHVVAPGVDTVLYHPPAEEVRAAWRARWSLPEDAFVWGLVGRVAAGKGADLACAALATLPGARDVPGTVPLRDARRGFISGQPPDHLLIAGSGWATAGVAAHARDLGLADRVHLVGDVEPPAAAYMASDAILFPTAHEESFGLAALEAMACGRAVIGAARGAVPEVLGGIGVLVRSRDPAHWAAEMAALRAAPQERMRMQVAGRRRAMAHYGRGRTVAALEQVYALAIGDAARYPQAFRKLPQ
jgi:glycosyltransferase involved in cell wall biosynthesis